jgi:hypothetical protein
MYFYWQASHPGSSIAQNLISVAGDALNWLLCCCSSLRPSNEPLPFLTLKLMGRSSTYRQRLSILNVGRALCAQVVSRFQSSQPSELVRVSSSFLPEAPASRCSETGPGQSISGDAQRLPDP